MGADDVVVVESKKSVKEVVEAMPAVCQANKFGVVTVIDLPAKMREKGMEFEKECVIVEVCSPAHAKRVLLCNMDISTMLPCRYSVIGTPTGSRICYARPSLIAALFPKDPVIDEVVQEVESILKTIADSLA